MRFRLRRTACPTTRVTPRVVEAAWTIQSCSAMECTGPVTVATPSAILTTMFLASCWACRISAAVICAATSCSLARRFTVILLVSPRTPMSGRTHSSALLSW